MPMPIPRPLMLLGVLQPVTHQLGIPSSEHRRRCLVCRSNRKRCHCERVASLYDACLDRWKCCVQCDVCLGYEKRSHELSRSCLRNNQHGLICSPQVRPMAQQRREAAGSRLWRMRLAHFWLHLPKLPCSGRDCRMSTRQFRPVLPPCRCPRASLANDSSLFPGGLKRVPELDLHRAFRQSCSSFLQFRCCKL